MAIRRWIMRSFDIFFGVSLGKFWTNSRFIGDLIRHNADVTLL